MAARSTPRATPRRRSSAGWSSEGRLGVKSGRASTTTRGRDLAAYRRDVLGAHAGACCAHAGPVAARRRETTQALTRRHDRRSAAAFVRRCRTARCTTRAAATTTRRAAGAAAAPDAAQLARVPRACCRSSARAVARSRSTPPASAIRRRARAGEHRGLGRRGARSCSTRWHRPRPRRRPPHRRRDRGRAGGARAASASPRWCCRRRRTPTRRSAARAPSGRRSTRSSRAATAATSPRSGSKRQPFYPPGRPELLQAFVADALKASGDVEAGHRAVASYRMEDRIGRGARAGAAAARERRSVRGAAPRRVAAALLPQAQVATIAGGVPLPDQLPARVRRRGARVPRPRLRR